MSARRFALRLAPPLALALLVLGIAAPVQAATEVLVRLARRSFIAGESATLDVVVRGASGSVADPDLRMPPGVEVLGSARSQNFSWINGRSSSETIFRYEIGSDRTGRYRIGPVQVRVGNQVFEGQAVDLEVTSAPRQVTGATRGAASLTADVTPSDPWVGQPVMLRVRLVQRAALAEAPDYAPPAATGFWSERASDPETYYAQQGGGRVLVTETRTRLYPLAPGRSTIGEATAAVVLDDESSPFSVFGIGQKTMILKSTPVPVNVRALPAGAPEGFTGAVGDLDCAWTPDRATTALDVPIVVRLDVRGRGNLPLLRTPKLEGDGFEVFGGSLEDSLPPPGVDGRGRRRFQWTILPSRPGRLVVPSPELVWFDTGSERYRRLDVPAIAVSVGPPLGGAQDPASATFPPAFASHPVDPGAGAAKPWALALAGALLGGAIVTARGARPDPSLATRRAQCREWLRAIGLAKGPDFWEAASNAAHGLGTIGSPTGSLGKEISASRYSGQFADEERIRRRLVELISAELEKGAPSPSMWIIAGALVVAAVALVLLFGPRAGDDRLRQRARAADQRARQGDLAAAGTEWRQLWHAGHAPGIAARLGWSDVRAGRVGDAAAWVLRGDAGEPRDPALSFVAERVREAGGLTGGWQGRLPIRSLEWGILAALFAGAGVWAWPRRGLAALGLVLGVLAAAAPAIESAARAPKSRAVVLQATPLEGADVDLEAGQVVRVVSQDGGHALVRIGTIEGRVPVTVLAEPDVVP